MKLYMLNFGVIAMLSASAGLGSCVGSDESVDYTIIVDEDAIKQTPDSLQNFLADRILQYEKRIPVPSFSSTVMIKTDTSWLQLALTERNWAQSLAISKQSWSNYVKHVKETFGDPDWVNRLNELPMGDQVLNTRAEGAYIVSCGGSGLKADTVANGVGAMLDIVEYAVSHKDKRSGIILDFRNCKLSPPPPDTPSLGELKKETYNTLRRWYDNLELLYQYTSDAKTLVQCKALVLNICTDGCEVEIQNIGQGKPQVFGIKEFLDRITKPDHFHYDDVRFFMRNYKVIKDYEPVDNASDLPPDLASLVQYDQVFEGKNLGKWVYGDVVSKQVDLIAKPTPVNVGDSLKIKYKIQISRISVVSAPK